MHHSRIINHSRIRGHYRIINHYRIVNQFPLLIFMDNKISEMKDLSNSSKGIDHLALLSVRTRNTAANDKSSVRTRK